MGISVQIKDLSEKLTNEEVKVKSGNDIIMEHELEKIKSGKVFENEKTKQNDRTRELEKERQQLQKIVEEIRVENEDLGRRNKKMVKEMKEVRKMRAVSATQQQSQQQEQLQQQLDGDDTFKIGYTKGKKESMVIIRTMSTDITNAEKESNGLRKELSKLTKIVEKYESKLKEYKKNTASKIKEVEGIVSKRERVGGQRVFSLKDLFLACGLTAIVLVCMMLLTSFGSAGRNVLLLLTTTVLIMFFGGLGYLANSTKLTTE